jgi:ABC-type branched-subunit amino acid transport system substrate-binding protein
MSNHIDRRKLLLVAGIAAAATGCSSLSSTFSGLSGSGATPAPTGSPSGEILGTGSVRVAMLLPQSATGNAGQLAQVFRNASEMALRDFRGADIQVMIKDTGGTPAGARAAAQAAISEGAELIIGPVFSQSVSSVASVARPSGKPMVSFSTDTSVAKRGVYLIGFLPQQDVARVISYAAAKGKTSFAALLPDNGYGTIVEAAFRQAVATAGGRVVGITRYRLDKGDMQTKAESFAEVAGRAQAVLIPDAGDAAPFLVQVLATKGIDRRKVQFLGSGQWDDPRILAETSLAGAWFPAPDKAGFSGFSTRYRAAYSSLPPRTATLAYDATILAAGLVRTAGARGFTSEVLTNKDGFLGIDGVFRFRADGTNERGLAIYEIAAGNARILAPAPRSFASGY